MWLPVGFLEAGLSSLCIPNCNITGGKILFPLTSEGIIVEGMYAHFIFFKVYIYILSISWVSSLQVIQAYNSIMEKLYHCTALLGDWGLASVAMLLYACHVFDCLHCIACLQLICCGTCSVGKPWCWLLHVQAAVWLIDSLIIRIIVDAFSDFIFFFSGLLSLSLSFMLTWKISV